jgi:hypothetical protein
VGYGPPLGAVPRRQLPASSRRRALVPEVRGVLETDDGATILFEWRGLAPLTKTGMRRLVGSVTHTTSDERYWWLNDRVGAVEGEVRPVGDGFEVVFEVAEMVWEPVG